MTKKPKRDESLSRLDSVLIEDILSTPDDQILAEAKEIFGSAEAGAAAARAALERAAILAKKARLAAAKEAVAGYKQQHSNVTALAPHVARRRLERFMASDPEVANRLTLAARKGTAPSDSDVQSMIQDLEELGIVLPDDDGDE